MNIIITGCLGHIGSALSRKLTKQGYNLIGIDNFSTQRYVSLRGLTKNKKFKFLEIDLAKIRLDDLSLLLKKHDISAWIHLSALTNAAKSFDFKKELMNNNLNSTKLAISYCEQNDIQIIFPSSTSVYGSAENEVNEDSDKFLNPQSPYAECKIEEEEALQMSSLKYYQILRLGTIFGVSPGMRFHTAVNKFCYQACLGEPLTIWKTAIDQYRPYLEINDCCNAFEFFLKNKNNIGIYNVNTNNFTVRNIIDEISNIIPDVQIEYVSNKIMNQLSYYVSNRKIINLGFSFKGELPHTIKETIKWLKYE